MPENYIQLIAMIIAVFSAGVSIGVAFATVTRFI